jgi:pectate lyase
MVHSAFPAERDIHHASDRSFMCHIIHLIHLGSNKTLVGIGDKAFFNRIGVLIQKKKNIVIRNIRFTMKNVPISKTDENKVVGFANGKAPIYNNYIHEGGGNGIDVRIESDVLIEKNHYRGLARGHVSTNLPVSSGCG